MLQQIWGRIQAIWSELALLLGVTYQISGVVEGVRLTQNTQTVALVNIGGTVGDVSSILGDPTYGNAALNTSLQGLPTTIAAQIGAAVTAVQGSGVGTLTDILAVLGALSDAVAALPVPPVPPTPAEIAGGVWDAIDPFSRDGATAYGAEQASPWDWTDLLKAAGSVPAKHSPFFNVSYPPPIPD